MDQRSLDTKSSPADSPAVTITTERAVFCLGPETGGTACTHSACSVTFEGGSAQ